MAQLRRRTRPRREGGFGRRYGLKRLALIALREFTDDVGEVGRVDIARGGGALRPGAGDIVF